MKSSSFPIGLTTLFIFFCFYSLFPAKLVQSITTMSRHPETNPYFIRPLQQRERPHPRTPSSPAVVSSTSPPHPIRDQGQQSKTQGPQPHGGTSRAPKKQYRSPWVQPPQHIDEDHPGGERQKSKYTTPWMPPPPHSDEGHQIPQVTEHSQKHPQKEQHPQQTQPKSKEQQGDNSQGGKPQDQDHSPLQYIGPWYQPGQQQDHSRGRSGLRAPVPQRTRPIIWLGAVFCTIFWIVIFLGGLIVLIVYLVYRPRSPRFEVSSVTMNAAYIDAGSLLNADISVLANFTNPNKKVGVDFNNVIIDLYFGKTLIATQYIASFSAPRAESRLANVHMISSQVRLPLEDVAQLEDQISRNAVIFNVKGVFRVRSNLGNFLKYTYRLYGRCTILMTAPPTGVLRATRCRTKR